MTDNPPTTEDDVEGDDPHLYLREGLAHRAALAIRPMPAGDAEYWRIRSAVSEAIGAALSALPDQEALLKAERLAGIEAALDAVRGTNADLCRTPVQAYHIMNEALRKLRDQAIRSLPPVDRGEG